jgi:hypothetical protein
MPTPKANNEAFRIAKKGPDDYELHQNSKCIAKADVKYQGNRFYLKGQPETLFNFDASLLPAKFQYQVIHEQTGFFDWYGLVTLRVVRKKILLEYSFSIDSDLLVNHDINPLKVLTSAMALAKKAGYKVFIDENDYLVDNRYASVEVHLPAKGNLYEHYQKHLKALQRFFQSAETAARKRIMKSTLPKRRG